MNLKEKMGAAGHGEDYDERRKDKGKGRALSQSDVEKVAQAAETGNDEDLRATQLTDLQRHLAQMSPRQGTSRMAEAGGTGRRSPGKGKGPTQDPSGSGSGSKDPKGKGRRRRM